MAEGDEDNATHEYHSLADFIMETLSLSVRCLYKAYIKVCHNVLSILHVNSVHCHSFQNCVADSEILSSLIVNILLLLQIFIPGND